jgi:hypothetical protein
MLFVVFHRLDMGENTFFLSLTFPDMAPQAELLGKLAVGTDAMELRVVSTSTNTTNTATSSILLRVLCSARNTTCSTDQLCTSAATTFKLSVLSTHCSTH